MKVWFILVHTSLRVVGDCPATKPFARTPTKAMGGFIEAVFFAKHQPLDLL